MLCDPALSLSIFSSYIFLSLFRTHFIFCLSLFLCVCVLMCTRVCFGSKQSCIIEWRLVTDEGSIRLASLTVRLLNGTGGCLKWAAPCLCAKHRPNFRDRCGIISAMACSQSTNKARTSTKKPTTPFTVLSPVTCHLDETVLFHLSSTEVSIMNSSGIGYSKFEILIIISSLSCLLESVWHPFLCGTQNEMFSRVFRLLFSIQWKWTVKHNQ